MRRPLGSPRRPPWWPHNEPWPGRRSLHGWPGSRARFFRRAAGAALAILALCVAGAVALAWAAAAALGFVAPAGPRAVSVLLAGGITGVVLAALGVLGVMRRVAMPIGGVMDAADRVAGGDYSVRVSEQGPPSIRALARSFNTMTARLQDNDRLRRDLMADVAHELRTPLTVIQGTLEGLLDGVYPRDDRHLQELLEEAHVLSRLVEDLRTLALSESGGLTLEKEPTDLGALAQDVAHTFAGDASERRVTLEVDAPDLAPIAIDPIRIREVIGNLLSNALRHTPPAGSVHVRVGDAPDRGSFPTSTSDPAMVVEVRDTGAGMTPDDLARAFDRFYKGPGSRGSGLGLSIARSLVSAHGGDMHASSETGRGTTITFTLPRR